MLAPLVLLSPLSQAAVAALSAFASGRSRRLSAALLAASAAGVLGAAACAAQVLSSGPGTAPIAPGLALRLDALSALLLGMIAVLALVIARFSITYFEGSPRKSAFLGRLAATVAAVELLVLADDLWLFWGAWVGTSLCLHTLLTFNAERPRAALAARKKFLFARLGDLTLGAALGLLGGAAQTSSMAAALARAPELDAGVIELCGLLLVLTALLKSAQFPTQGWLIEVVEAPTPVSALLHAGILNAGPFLILRFSPLVVSADAASALLILGGGATALFASVALLTQPTVKVALGYSSAAHMGFMLAVCGLGVFPAAALHLIAHSFYKAHAFLTASSVVDQTLRARVPVAARSWRPQRALLALCLGAATYAGVASGLGHSPWSDPALLLVGLAFGLGLTQLLAAGLDRRAASASAIAGAVTLAALVTLAFFLLEELAGHALAGVVPVAAPRPALILALGALVIAAWASPVLIVAFGWGRDSELAEALRVHLRHGLYADALLERALSPQRAAPAADALRNGGTHVTA